uniref:Uncharacterized protein n=1 Tax=Geobacillus sp. (strain WCH70) TaxID=471223 RepID=C5DB36_GEOSW
MIRMEEISISIPKEVLEKVEKSMGGWDDRNRVITNHLVYFYRLLETEKRTLTKIFSEEELLCIYAAFNGTIVDFRMTPGMFKATVRDALKYGELDFLISEHRIDAGAFLQKIDGLSDLQTFVLLVDAQEYWAEKSR